MRIIFSFKNVNINFLFSLNLRKIKSLTKINSFVIRCKFSLNLQFVWKEIQVLLEWKLLEWRYLRVTVFNTLCHARYGFADCTLFTSWHEQSHVMADTTNKFWLKSPTTRRPFRYQRESMTCLDKNDTYTPNLQSNM